MRLGKSIRVIDLRLLESRSFHELLDYISSDDVDLNKVKRLVEKVNKELEGRKLHIQIRKAVPWDKKADYRLILRYK